jgi:hypothetical protein
VSKYNSQSNAHGGTGTHAHVTALCQLTNGIIGQSVVYSGTNVGLEFQALIGAIGTLLSSIPPNWILLPNV